MQWNPYHGSNRAGGPLGQAMLSESILSPFQADARLSVSPRPA